MESEPDDAWSDGWIDAEQTGARPAPAAAAAATRRRRAPRPEALEMRGLLAALGALQLSIEQLTTRVAAIDRRVSELASASPTARQAATRTTRAGRSGDAGSGEAPTTSKPPRATPTARKSATPPPPAAKRVSPKPAGRQRRPTPGA